MNWFFVDKTEHCFDDLLDMAKSDKQYEKWSALVEVCKDEQIIDGLTCGRFLQTLKSKGFVFGRDFLCMKSFWKG